MIIGRSSTKFLFFMPIGNPRWLPPQVIVLTLDHMRSRHFEFHIGTKNLKFVEDHPMNIHAQFGFNHICSFWEEGIWTFSHRVQKMFQNASSLKPLGQLKPNCPGMIIGRFSTKFMFFMSIGNPRWHHRNT
jgi:hypothetical protein